MDWQFNFDEIVGLDEEQLRVILIDFPPEKIIHILKMALDLTKSYETVLKSSKELIELYEERLK